MGTSAKRVVSVAKLYHFENGMATFVNVDEADPRPPGDSSDEDDEDDDTWWGWEEDKPAADVDAVAMSILDFYVQSDLEVGLAVPSSVELVFAF